MCALQASAEVHDNGMTAEVAPGIRRRLPGYLGTHLRGAGDISLSVYSDRQMPGTSCRLSRAISSPEGVGRRLATGSEASENFEGSVVWARAVQKLTEIGVPGGVLLFKVLPIVVIVRAKCCECGARRSHSPRLCST